jgi:hypothetical protein
MSGCFIGGEATHKTPESSKKPVGLVATTQYDGWEFI